jgi:hypothetical protein
LGERLERPAIAREHVRWVHSDTVCALSEGLAEARPRKIFIEQMFVARVPRAKAKLHSQIIEAGKSPMRVS